MIKFSSSHLHLEPKEPSQNNFIWQNVISTSHQQLNSVKIVEIALKKKNLQNLVLKQFTLIAHLGSDKPCFQGSVATWGWWLRCWAAQVSCPSGIFLEVDIGICSLCNILAVDLQVLRRLQRLQRPQKSRTPRCDENPAGQ